MSTGTPTRSVRKIVTFRSGFTLRWLDGEQPPGDYVVETDEELIQGISRFAYRRIATHLHLPSRSRSPTTQQMVLIDPAELDAALLRDRFPILTT